MPENRLLSESDLWFSPSQMKEGAKNALLYPFRNPEQVAETGLSIAPGSGEAMSARDAWNASGRAGNALLQGNFGEAASGYGDMALGIMGAIPGTGIIARGTKRGAAWMDRNLPAGVNRLLDSITPSDPRNTTFIFAGPTAKTADHAALARAQDMAASGASRDDIWRDTGWLQGVDRKWRFEIDDSAAALKDVDQGKFSGLTHPEFEKAYGLGIDIEGSIGAHYPAEAGSYSRAIPATPELPFETPPYIMAIGRTPDEARSVSLHELQHHVQTKEGFAPGGSPLDTSITSSLYDDVLSNDILALRRDLVGGKYGEIGSPTWITANEKYKQAEAEAIFKVYERLAGEVEARNVQARLPMSAADRRAKAPWLTQDVPDDQQIVRYR